MALKNKWSRDNKKGFGSKFKNMFKSKEPIKPKFEEAQKKLHIQISKLDIIHNKLKEKDQTLFSRVVKYMQERDMQSAAILSRELAQVRKIKSMVNYSKLALEQINLRMGTMTELGDVVVTLNPAMAVINNIKGDINNMMPEVSNEMNEVTDLLNEIMIDSSDIPTGNQLPINQLTNDEDVQQILEEATAIIENDVKDKIPELPTSMQVMNSEPPFVKSNQRKYPDLPSTRKKRVESLT
ncbi:MAG: hypothetical protein D6752_07105 [Candidatus Nitrosothermus koennekii]|nr:MAG: hypothetical protein D6752_07105 [Candidatus Nitrosothermus koennekii]